MDAHSKWPEVHIMKETTTAKTIDILRKMFAAFGPPEQLVTNNGPQFVSEDFAAFTKSNGIRHICCAPDHPASNGLAERFVQSLKMNLKSTLNIGLSLSQHVSNYFVHLQEYSTCYNWSFSFLFLHRQICTWLDLLRTFYTGSTENTA